MTPDIEERVLEIIDRYGLHDSTPVKLWSLEDLYLVRYIDMRDMESLGAILPPQHGWPVTPTNRARILIDHALGDAEARIIIAHEIGHGICQHIGAASSLPLGMLDKHEREAWEVAAMLLIPPHVAFEEGEISRIAAACEVPESLVEIWRSISG